MKQQHNYNYHQGIKIKSPHLLRIRNFNNDGNNNNNNHMQLYKAPKLMSSNGQTTFSFKQQTNIQSNNNNKNEGIKLFNPIQQQQLQMASYYNSLLKQNSNTNSIMDQHHLNNRSNVSNNNITTTTTGTTNTTTATNKTTSVSVMPIAYIHNKPLGNKSNFAQIKELSTLESGENQKKYRKIKHDKLKELKAYRNSNMNTITSQANNNETNSCYSNSHKITSNSNNNNGTKNIIKTISQKNYIDASNHEFKRKIKTIHTDDIDLIPRKKNDKSLKRGSNNQMNRSQSVYSKKSVYSSDRSCNLNQFNRSHSNKKDVLMIIDQTIQGLNKLRTIFNDNDDDESIRNYDKQNNYEDSFELEINRLQKKQLQNGIKTMTEFIRKSFNTGGGDEILLKNKRNDGHRNHNKRTITEVSKFAKNNKRFNESEKDNSKKRNYSFYEKKKKKNLFLLGVNRNLTPIVAKKNVITNFDQEYLMSNAIYSKGNNKDKENDNERGIFKMNNQRSNTNPNINVLNANDNIMTNCNNNSKKKGNCKKVISRYESENDTLTNFQFSDVDLN